MDVAVVGGGWAGLAAAVELARQGARVTLYESGKGLGGRARCVTHQGRRFDNGQHLMLGAYRATRSLLRTVGVAETKVLDRRPLRLRWYGPEGKRIEFSAPPLPAPLHLVWGLARLGGMDGRSRRAALRLALSAGIKGFVLSEDQSVAQWLRHHRQPKAVIEGLWEPLCLAALSTPIETASARGFLRVLHDAFARKAADSDLLYLRTGLGQVLPEPASRFIEQQGGKVVLGRRVNQLVVEGGRAVGVKLAGATVRADQVILAVPPRSCHRILSSHRDCDALCNALSAFRYEPICTVYLEFPPEADVGFDQPMVGLLGTIGQWVFDHGHYGRPGFLSVVISGPGPHMNHDAKTLGHHIAAELGERFPHWPAPRGYWVIREKQAVFSCQVDVDRFRPGHRTPVAGCWLAGDYTDTGYPGTLEGAVRSGLDCARRVLDEGSIGNELEGERSLADQGELPRAC